MPEDVQWGAQLDIDVICETQSFPRKRESTPQTLGNVLSSGWIPAFAGMTGAFAGMAGGSIRPLFHMTPARGVVIC
jgi:hypothetical protein